MCCFEYSAKAEIALYCGLSAGLALFLHSRELRQVWKLELRSGFVKGDETSVCLNIMLGLRWGLVLVK